MVKGCLRILLIVWTVPILVLFGAYVWMAHVAVYLNKRHNIKRPLAYLAWWAFLFWLALSISVVVVWLR